MTVPAQKLSKLLSAEGICVIMLALVVVVFAAGATLAQNKGAKTQTKGSATVTAADNQVSFTATGTATITGVTKLPNGVTQINFDTTGSATHLGNFTGPLTRLQDNQGNFCSTAVIVGANGKDSIFFSVSGRFDGGKGGDKCVVTSTGTYTVTGGAGAFANATGTYTGTISNPNSN